MAAMPGQRIIVLISPGFISPTDYQPEKNDILNHAIKANLVINALDARGLWVDPMVDASQSSAAHPGVPHFQANDGSYERQRASRRIGRIVIRYWRRVFPE